MHDMVDGCLPPFNLHLCLDAAHDVTLSWQTPGTEEGSARTEIWGAPVAEPQPRRLLAVHRPALFTAPQAVQRLRHVRHDSQPWIYWLCTEAPTGDTSPFVTITG